MLLNVLKSQKSQISEVLTRLQALQMTEKTFPFVAEISK